MYIIYIYYIYVYILYIFQPNRQIDEQGGTAAPSASLSGIFELHLHHYASVRQQPELSVFFRMNQQMICVGSIKRRINQRFKPLDQWFTVVVFLILCAGFC